MTKRVASLVLAIVMLLQILVPQTIIAKEEVKAPSDNLVTLGVINGTSYDPKLMLELNRFTAKNRTKRSANPGISLFGYFEDGQEPKDRDKLKYHGEVKADLKVTGLDGNPFQWNEIFGKEEVHLRFIQTNDNTGIETGTERVLNISQGGTYTWTDGDGVPAELPLFNDKLEPLIYEVKLDEEVSDKVKLLTARLTTTGDASPTFDRPDADGRIKYHLTLEIGLQQVASSKFVSEWHTAVEEGERPQIQGTMKTAKKTAIFDLPKNDTNSIILRTNSTREGRKPGKIFVSFLYKTPTTDIKTDTTGLNFEDNNGVKTVTSGDHKFKYDFKYDVINGGKLTMTEIIPVTFDANGGKFASIADSSAEQKIVKEVEYDGTLTEKAEEPTKDRETFKGWSDTKGGTTPVNDDAFKNIKEAKIFYAIWDNNDIVADQLEVKESFKDGDTWVNDFIPKLADLKKQVKIKDANGDPQALSDNDIFAIVDGTNEYKTDAAAKDYLYNLLKEDDKTEVSRDVKIKAKITLDNGTSQTVEIPIKVIKNIYEAKTKEGKPSYVPNDYVKVTVDPTTKAKDPQKYFYYVNPKAKVIIPGEDPTGTGNNKFVKWTMKEDSATGEGSEYKLSDKPRTRFEKASTITAQYVSDVIEQTDPNNKPDTVPNNYVKVTFVPTDNATDATKANQIFWVNPGKEVTIPVKDPVGKTYYTFKEWKIGVNADGDVYTPSTAKKFTEATTITATYDEDKNIISYDPKEPITRPEGYVRVTFEAEEGLKLTESKAYYVKQNAGIKLGNTELVKPGVKAETGYKFKEWDKKDELVIQAADIVVTAKATKLDNVIPEKKEDGTPNEKPKGYKEVTFVIKTEDAAKGSITGVAKFYVNPTEYVTITPPTTKAETGFEFGTWYKDTTIPTVYDKDTTITGSFNVLKDVIPKTNPDGSENKQPARYKKVEFVIDPATGGKIVDKEVTIYYVNPAKEVTVPQPKTAPDTGYEFEKWKIGDQEFPTEAKKYTEDTTVKGNFKKLDDIIPEKTGNTPNAKPNGYVTVTFDKGEHGKEITGQTVYYVNPKAGKTLANIQKPTVKAETGWKANGWDKADITPIKGTEDITVTAKYEELDDVIPKNKPTGGENDKPDGYITVKFSTETNGKIKDTDKTEKIVYVNPTKAVELKGFDPAVTPNTGYDFANWDTPIDKKIQYSDGDVIKALYNEKDDVIPQEKTDGKDKPAGYLTVTFDKGDHGTLSGKTVYYVKPNKEVTVPAPTVNPEVGYKQKDGTNAWDKLLTQTFTEDTKITAQYAPLENIIPGDQTKPDGYLTVEFKAENGSLAGTTTYYVKPGVEVNLSDKANALTKNPDLGYTAEGGTWDPTLGAKTYTENATYTFKFKKLKDVITGTEVNERPKGYAKVEFKTDKNGSLEGNTIFYVNPKAGKKMTDITAPTIKANKGYKVGSPNWNPDFTNDTSEIKEDRIYVANYEALGEAKITYIPRDPEMGSVSPGSEDLSEDQAIQGSTATAKPGYEFVNWVDADGKEVSKDKTFKPTEKVGAVYIAVFKAKDPITFTVNKVWDGDVNPVPTMNFTLYRKVEDGTEEAVLNAAIKEITKTTTEASWKDLPKEDSNGKPYTYSVKETFKDENDVKNDNWILGEMVTSNGENTITNKLKTVPGTGETPKQDDHRMGKLTITKKIESNVTKPQVVMFGVKAPAAPLAFTFKVIDPYGNVVKVDGQDTFTLKANETKTLENLLYGEHTIEEIDAKGLTPFVKVGDGKETESKTGKVTLTTTDKEGTVTFTNKNVKPQENLNIIEVKATKVWVNGPSKDHTAVDLKLYRQADGGQKEEVTDVKAEVTRVVSGDPTFNYVWKDLPSINDEGKEYTYTVEEAGVTNNEVKVGDNTYVVTQNGNTITNTYVVPKTDDLVATKQWVGVPDGTAKPEVKFQLQRTVNGQTEDVGNAKDLTNNQVNFGKQDKTDANGNVYVYSVKELGEDGNAFNHSNYTSEVKGLTVTNTYHAPEVKYTVTYLPGSSTATGKMNPEVVAENTIYTVLSNGFKNPSYTFKGWMVDNGPTIVQPGDRITVKGNVTLTAQWEKTTTPPTPDNPNPGHPDRPDPWNPNPWTPGHSGGNIYIGGITEKIVEVPAKAKALRKEVRYMQGFNGYFRPNDGLTRAEAAQILANALIEDGYNYNHNYQISYKDIGRAWYTEAIRITTEANVFAGYDDGLFRPEKKITRAEWVATLRRFQNIAKADGNHMNLSANHWAKSEVEGAFNEGWLKIYTDGLAKFNADEFIPRQEVAAVSNRAFNRVFDKTYIDRNDKALINQYKDVKPSMWAYEDILCASNTFVHDENVYRAHDVKNDKVTFNVDLGGLEIIQDKFQRILR